MLVILPRRRPLVFFAGAKRVGLRSSCSLRPLGHELCDVFGKFGKDRAGEMHAAGIGKGFERPGNVEIALDFQQGRSPPVASTVPEAFAREAPRPSMPRPSIVQVGRMVISEFRLAPK